MALRARQSGIGNNNGLVPCNWIVCVLNDFTDYQLWFAWLILASTNPPSIGYGNSYRASTIVSRCEETGQRYVNELKRTG